MRFNQFAKKALVYASVAALAVGSLETGAMSARADAIQEVNDDIVLKGDDNGNSSMIGSYSITGGYKYLGFATLGNVTSDYKYMIITYKGDLSSVRFQAIHVGDTEEMGGTYWFDETNPEGHFVTADGSSITLNATEPTTIVIDLEKTGIDTGYYNGFHMHAGNGTDTNLVIGNARLSKSSEINSTDVIPEETTSQAEETTSSEETVPTVLKDISLDASYTDSPLVREWSTSATEGYAYLGYAYVGASAGYKYLELTYKGDATAFNDLRFEFVGGTTNGFVNPYGGQFVTVAGTAVPAPSSEEQTVVIDLAASGVDVTKPIEGIHVHQTAGNGNFEITSAVLKASYSDPTEYKEIVLSGDEAGNSSMIKTYKAPTQKGVAVDTYKYLGFATLLDCTSDYKYMIIKYQGNITGLRFQFAYVDENGNEKAITEPYWFNKEGQTLYFETYDGSDIVLNAETDTYVIIDLEKSGIDLGTYNSVHMHCEGMATNGNFEIKDAYIANQPVIVDHSSEQPTTEEPTTEKTTTEKATTKVVKPARVVVKKAAKKASAKRAKITLKKVAKAKGYQVKISTSKKFTKKTTKTINTKKVNIVVKKLKANKKYFVKARAYVLSNKTKVYGAWSKTVKVKKTK